MQSWVFLPQAGLVVLVGGDLGDTESIYGAHTEYRIRGYSTEIAPDSISIEAFFFSGTLSYPLPKD